MISGSNQCLSDCCQFWHDFERRNQHLSHFFLHENQASIICLTLAQVSTLAFFNLSQPKSFFCLGIIDNSQFITMQWQMQWCLVITLIVKSSESSWYVMDSNLEPRNEEVPTDIFETHVTFYCILEEGNSQPLHVASFQSNVKKMLKVVVVPKLKLLYDLSI